MAALSTDYWGLVAPYTAVLYRFNGTPGQRLYFDSLGTNYNSSSFHLYHPTGVEIRVAWWYGADFGPITVSDPGLYTLILEGNAEG